MEFSYYSKALGKTVNVNVLLPEIDKHIPNAPAGSPDIFVAGLSMGGYGALKIALTYPERCLGCAYFSAVLDITRKGCDVYALASKCKEEGKPFPKMYAWCGTVVS